jgi:protein gp37
MPQKSPIEWTDYTSNPIYAINKETNKRGWFCVKVSPGCGHCYAENLNVGRFGNKLHFTENNLKKVEFVLNEKELLEIVKLDTRLAKKSETAKLFLGDMMDIFLEEIPDAFLNEIFAVAALCPNITFQLLTKRAERLNTYLNNIGNGSYHIFDLTKKYLPDWYKSKQGFFPFPLSNVHLGVSVENQKAADERIPLLLETPAAVRWLSCEPLLSEVDLEWVGKSDHWDYTRWNCLTGEAFAVANPNTDNEIAWDSIQPNGSNPIDWVVVGGESGNNARPMNPDWVRSIRDQCEAAGVPFFFKQWGNWFPFGEKPPEGKSWEIGIDKAVSHTHLWNDGNKNVSVNIGKKNSGRFLDGRTWDEFTLSSG